MSATKHGISCHCSKCLEFNCLHGKANKLVDEMLEAAEAGKEEEARALCNQLEQAHSQSAELGEELNR